MCSKKLNKSELLSNSNRVDILFIIFLTIFSVYFFFQVTLLDNPTRDGADYLLNARDWLANESLYSPYRPPLISWIIAGLWLFSSESWVIIKYVIPLFTIASGLLLYILVRKQKGAPFAFGVSALTLLNQIVFFWGMQIQTENLSLFFLILTLYFVKSEKANHWYLAGVSMALTFASRYPIFIQAISILIIESLIRRNSKIPSRAIIMCIAIVALVIIAVYTKTGTFSGAVQADTRFTFLLSPYYLLHSTHIWSIALYLVPIALLFRRTYSDKNNYTYIAWFFVSLLFWSANATNHQERFMVPTTPAVYYLAILALENITKINSLNNWLTDAAKRFSTR